MTKLSGMFKALVQALRTEPIGGTRQTIQLMMISSGFASAFPPFATLFHNKIITIGPYGPVTACKLAIGAVEVCNRVFQLSSVSFRSTMLAEAIFLAAAAVGSFHICHELLRPKRKEFILPTSCKVESSDPPAYKPDTPGLLFGYTTDDGSPLFISDDDMCRHGIIVGQTGMGKSVFGKSLMFQQIQRGGGLLFVDGKLDGDNIQDVYEYCVYCGRGHDFLVVNPGQPEKSNTYNPILFGDPDEVAARIISLIPSTATSAGADYYKQSANLALVCFISALQEESPAEVKKWMEEAKAKGVPLDYVNSNRVKGKAYNFLDLALLTMNEGVLNSLMTSVKLSSPDSLTRKNLSIFLEQYAKEQNMDGKTGKVQIDLKRLKETLGGIGARMHQFGSGNFGPVLNSYSPEVKMYEAIRDNKIVYIALPTMGKDVAAQNLGKIVIADLRTSISWLQMNKQDRPKIPFLAFMDEMSSYSTETLAVMFEQARSARVALLPAIQTDSGLSNISEDFKERIMANTELKIFFRLSSQDTALTASELIGETTRVTRSTSIGTGESASAQALELGPNKSLSASESHASGEREQAEPLVHQDEIKALQAGECLVLRSPRLWSIRIPMIELSPSIKAAIGPLQISQGRKASKSEQKNFDAMQSVDDYIKEAQAGRVKPQKEKAAPQESKGKADQPKRGSQTQNSDSDDFDTGDEISTDSLAINHNT